MGIFKDDDLVNLYDEDVVRIGKISAELVDRWSGRTNSQLNLDLLEKEAVARFTEIGFTIQVDTTPCLVGHAPVISITGRTDAHVFDVEKKRWEVLKAKIRGQRIHGQS